MSGAGLRKLNISKVMNIFPGHGDFPPLGWIDKEWIDEVKSDGR